MSSIKLDLKQFQHVSSDGKTTTLKHAKDGHEIRLAHKALSKDNQEQLKALAACGGKVDKMAEGGKVDSKKKDDKDKKRPATIKVPNTPAGVQQSEIMRKQGDSPFGTTIMIDEDYDDSIDDDREKLKGRKKMASGGSVDENEPVMNEEVVQQPVIPEALKPAEVMPAQQPQMPTININLGPQGAQQQQQAATPPPQQPLQTQAEMQARLGKAVPASGVLQPGQEPSVPAGEMATRDQAQAVAPMQPGAAADEMMPEEGSAAPQAPDMGLINPQSAAPALPQPTMPGGLGSPEGMMAQGYKDRLAGIDQSVNAQGDLALEQEGILADRAAALQEAQDTYKQQWSTLDNERQAFMDDIKNSHISPERYWTGDPKTGEGGHSKLMTGIGIIIAGYNPAGGENAAINFLKYQMDKNMESQKANLSKKENLLSYNMKQFGNLKDAMDMTRVMQSDIVQTELQAAAARATSPIAKAAAMQAIGQLKMESSAKFQELIKNRTLQQLSANISTADPASAQKMINALRAVDPKKAEEMAERLVPGAGFANTPEDAKMLKEVENRRSNIRENSKKLLALVKDKGTYEVFGSHNADLDTLAEQIATDQAKLQDPNSVARPSEVESVKKNLITAGLGSRNQTAEVQLKNFFKTVDQRAEQAYKTRGMRPPMSSAPSLTQGVDPASKAKAAKWLETEGKKPQNKAKADQIRKALGI